MDSVFQYAIVRCVPEPRTGEFMNIGAIAGNPDTGDWAVRRISSEARASRFADAGALDAVHSFLTRADRAIQTQASLFEQDRDVAEFATLTADWLEGLYRDHRGIVQLAQPSPMMAGSAEAALDLIFERMIVDPVSEPRTSSTTKHAVLKGVRDAYRVAQLPVDLVRPWADMYVGANLHSKVDFAIANGEAVQLTQAWSFQIQTLDDLSTRIKSWGYAMSRVRDGETAKIMDGDEVSDIALDVDLRIVIAPPETDLQTETFEEAEQVFYEVGATVHELEAVDEVAERAAALIALHRTQQ